MMNCENWERPKDLSGAVVLLLTEWFEGEMAVMDF